MDIGAFQSAVTYLDVPFGDEVARIGYSVRNISAVGMTKAKALAALESEDAAEVEKAERALEMILADFIGEWDLTWHGEPMPPSAESMARLSFPVKLKLLMAIAEELQPPKALAVSLNGSTAEARAGSVPNGTGSFA